MTTTAPLRSVALLERAVGYTRAALALVDESRLGDPTPCDAWDLRALLVHMDDSLAAFTEAAALGQVDLRPLAGQPEAHRLVETLRLRACAVLGAWTARDADEPVGVGRGVDAVSMDAGLLASVGALEITVHGWDVAQACGADLPIPDTLAEALLEVAVEVVGDADRGVRFARPQAPHLDHEPEPGTRLLAFLGR